MHFTAFAHKWIHRIFQGHSPLAPIKHWAMKPYPQSQDNTLYSVRGTGARIKGGLLYCASDRCHGEQKRQGTRRAACLIDFDLRGLLATFRSSDSVI